MSYQDSRPVSSFGESSPRSEEPEEVDEEEEPIFWIDELEEIIRSNQRLLETYQDLRKQESRNFGYLKNNMVKQQQQEALLVTLRPTREGVIKTRLMNIIVTNVQQQKKQEKMKKRERLL